MKYIDLKGRIIPGSRFCPENNTTIVRPLGNSTTGKLDEKGNLLGLRRDSHVIKVDEAPRA